MAVLEHALDADTMRLIEQALMRIPCRLAIYGPHNWAMENTSRMGFFAFDPALDSHYLHDEIMRALERGYF